MRPSIKLLLLLGILFTAPLSAQDCECVEKDSYEYVQYKGRYRTLNIAVECDSLFSMEVINDFLNFGDIYYEVARDFFGWEFIHPVSLVTTVNPSLRGAGTGFGGTGYSLSNFGINLDGFDQDTYAAAFDRNGTIVHEGIHRWDFRGANYFQGPDIAHPLTVGLQDYLYFKTGLNVFGLFQETNAALSSDLEIKRRYKYFWRRYLSNPDLNWDYYFSRGLTPEEIFDLAPKPEAYERLAIQGATLLSVYFMHGEEGLRSIFAEIDRLRKEDPTWDRDFDVNSVRERYIRIFGDALQVDVSDYFDYWKYPISDELRSYLGQYPTSPMVQDSDSDGFSPLQGDFNDDDRTAYPDAPELPDGKDNNQDGQIDELVHNESAGDFPDSGAGTTLTLPTLIQGNLSSLEDIDAFTISLPERAYVTVVYTALNADTVLRYGDYQIGIFDGVLRRNGEYYMRQDVQSGENNLHRSEYWEAGNYRLTIDGLDSETCPGDYEIQIFVNTQQPVVFEKDGFSYKHHVYIGVPADPNFDVNQVNGVTPAEAGALKRLYEQNGGADWDNKIGWLATEDVCFWRGLNCDRTGISKLVLSDERAINGPIDASILEDLSNLREFDLRSANFEGQPMPDVFEDWRNLSMLRAHFDNIGGQLPAFSGSKKKFWLLDLRGNQFSGNIPDSWSNLTELKFLDIFANQLTGALPEDFHRLEKLESFFFDQDKICVPNQAVWDWLQAIPETDGRNFQRCNQVPSDITMLTPIDEAFELQTDPDDNIRFAWTPSQDPENAPINYTWVLANEVERQGQRIMAPILEIDVVSGTELNFTRAALADSLAARGFGDRINDFFHYAVATDGDWFVTTDTVAIELSLAARPCAIAGEMITEANACFTTNSGKATVQLSNGFGSLRYAWSNGSTEAALDKLPAGNYEVLVEDQTGCQQTLYGFVPVSNLTADVVRAGSDVLTSVAGGVSPYAIGWHDEVLGAERELAPTSTYSAVIVDAQGCQQLVLSPPILEPASGQTATSFVISWQTVPSASGYLVQVAADEDFTQLLAGFENVEVDNPAWFEIDDLEAAGEYFYRVAAFSADARSAFSAPQRIRLTEEACQLFVAGDTEDIVRNGNAGGTIDVAVFGGTGTYTYQWSDGGNGATRTDLAEGTYTVSVSDNAGCTAEKAFAVERLERYAIGNLVWHDRNRNGLQESGEPGIPGVKVYMWQDDNRDGNPERGGVVETDENGLWRHENLDPGSYLIFVWEVDNFDPGGPLFEMVNSPGSLDTDNDFPIDDNGEPGSVNNPLPFGSVASRYIVLGGGGEPLGDGDSQGDTFDQDPSGNMTVDFGFFRRDECPDMTARFTGDLLLCDADDRGTITAEAFNAIGPVRYQWSPTQQTANLLQVGPGSYTVSLTDAVGCKQTVEVEIRTLEDFTLDAVIINETGSGAMDGSIDLPDSLLAGLDFTWSNGSTEIDQANLAAGEYRLTVNRGNGCEAVFTYTVGLTTTTTYPYRDLGLRITPNPSAGAIQLQAMDASVAFGTLDGQIIDLKGRVLQQFSTNGLAGFNQQLRSASQKLRTGSYLLRLKTEGKVASEVFVIF